jgi:hypothetical protein
MFSFFRRIRSLSWLGVAIAEDLRSLSRVMRSEIAAFRLRTFASSTQRRTHETAAARMPRFLFSVLKEGLSLVAVGEELPGRSMAVSTHGPSRSRSDQQSSPQCEGTLPAEGDLGRSSRSSKKGVLSSFRQQADTAAPVSED